MSIFLALARYEPIRLSRALRGAQLTFELPLQCRVRCMVHANCMHTCPLKCVTRNMRWVLPCYSCAAVSHCECICLTVCERVCKLVRKAKYAMFGHWPNWSALNLNDWGLNAIGARATVERSKSRFARPWPLRRVDLFIFLLAIYQKTMSFWIKIWCNV